MMAHAPAVWIRRTLAALLVVLVVGAVLASALGTRRERADFVFTGGGEVRSLDPHAATGIPEGRVIRALFEGLVVRDPQTLAPAPGCAETWEISADGLTYTFHLRADARWSNGEPVTAADFVWSWTRLLEPRTGAEYAAQLWCVAGAREFASGGDGARDPAGLGLRALDERTFEVRLTEVQPRFLDVLCFYAFVPLHRASIEALQAQHPTSWGTLWTRPEHLVSNGAYYLAERRIHERIRLAKSPHYWDADGVAMRTIDVLALESWSSALNLYLTGEIDWVDGAIPSNLVERLKEREDFRATPYLGVYFYRVNTTRPPLDDLRVRQALSRAVRRAEITNNVLKAGQAPCHSFTAWSRVGSYNAPTMPPEDPVAAASLLAAAGFATPASKGVGKPFPKLELHFNSSETHRALAEVVAHQWKQILGIDAKLRNQEWKAFLSAQSSLDYDLSRSSWIGDYADAGNFLEIWTSDSPNNRTGWKNARYDELIARARGTLNEAQRNALYYEAEQILLRELPCIPIYSYVSQNLVNPRLGGFDDNALNEPSLASLYWRDGAELDAARQADKRGKKRAPAPGPNNGLRSPRVDAMLYDASGGAQGRPLNEDER